MKRINSLEEVDALIADGSRLGDEAKRISLLSQYYFDPGIRSDADPFSEDYIQEMLDLHATISGVANYDPAKSELMSPHKRADIARLVRSPPPFDDGSEIAGDFLLAIGFLIRTLKLGAGSSVLEYGAGGGHLSITLARSGLNVTAVDIEPAYIEAIRRQCRALDVPIKAEVRAFGDLLDDRRYDAVLFFEAFHHCVRHNHLLQRIASALNRDGMIVLGGEPILADDSYWAPTLPFPWGPRCDVLSLCAMRRLGWMELGFRESYIGDAFRRIGFHIDRHDCPLTDRGRTYVARRILTPAQPVARAMRNM